MKLSFIRKGMPIKTTALPRRLSFSLGACTLCLFGTMVTAGPLGPFVDEVGTHSARVTWIDDESSPTFELRKGTTWSPAAVVEKAIPNDPVEPSRRKRKERVFSVHLGGLQPGSRTEYRLVSAHDTVTGFIKTASDSTRPFRFVLIGDNRSNPDMFAKIARMVADEQPWFVINSGDLTVNGNEFEGWEEQFFAPAESLLRTTPMFVAKGNHERTGVHFDLMFKEWYSYEHANMHVSIINSYTAPEKVDEMVAWLDKDLASTNKRWKVVAYHFPTFNIGGHATAWGRTKVYPLLKKHGVDLVLTGHSHLYERFLPIGEKGKKPMQFIVSGGAGAGLVRAKQSPLLAGGMGIAQHHYCVFDIEGDLLQCTVKNSEGQVVDQFEMKKEGETFAPGYLSMRIDETEALLMTGFADAFHTVANSAKSNDSAVVCVLTMSGLPRGLQVSVSVDCKARTFWKCQPFTHTVKSALDSVEITVVSSGPYTFGWGGFLPDLRFKVKAESEEAEFAATLSVGIPKADATLLEPVAVKKLNAPVSVDGKPDEWNGVAPLYDYVNNHEGVLQLGWNQQGLCGYLHYQDTAISTTRGNFFNADAVEIWIEFTNEKKEKLHEWSKQFVLFPPGKAGLAAKQAAPYTNQIEQYTPVKTAGVLTNDGYAIEFCIPASEFKRGKLAPGTYIGFNYALNDDGDPVVHFSHHKQLNNSFMHPVSWGTLLLSR